jgi:hypothetical protein
MIAEDSRFIQDIEEWLTIEGLRILFERNRNGNSSARAHSRPR